YQQQLHTYPLDPHNLTHPLNNNLPFTPQHPKHNIPPIPQLTKLILHPPLITITPFISPYQPHPHQVRNLLHHKQFIQIYTSSTIQTSESTHPKPLYQKPTNR
ncbi:adenylyl-sulfate kinase, partial [Staphylococcus saprophyticus]|uniref:adenylyl-sulfate kinase n=1 Tax=Staphylococcus saprophyticus TaxID=29385 RepID=UPI0011A016C9